MSLIFHSYNFNLYKLLLIIRTGALEFNPSSMYYYINIYYSECIIIVKAQYQNCACVGVLLSDIIDNNICNIMK